MPRWSLCKNRFCNIPMRSTFQLHLRVQTAAASPVQWHRDVRIEDCNKCWFIMLVSKKYQYQFLLLSFQLPDTPASNFAIPVACFYRSHCICRKRFDNSDSLNGYELAKIMGLVGLLNVDNTLCRFLWANSGS